MLSVTSPLPSYSHDCHDRDRDTLASCRPLSPKGSPPSVPSVPTLRTLPRTYPSFPHAHAPAPTKCP